jgi:hypothetical protein
MSPKNKDLPGIEGPGVAPLSIPEIDKAIAKYQRKKEARCNASPDEIAAKNEVKALLHQHRDELPVNGDGVPFYRSEDRDYVLEEKLSVRKVHDDEDEDDD